MSDKMILSILQQVYQAVLRDLLRQAVESTETPWDDRILAVCDTLLHYDYRTPRKGV